MVEFGKPVEVIVNGALRENLTAGQVFMPPCQPASPRETALVTAIRFAFNSR
jgi:hypothetical protein